MRKWVLLPTLAAMLLSGCAAIAPEPTPTASATHTATPSHTSTLTSSPTATATATLPPTLTPSETPSPTLNPTPERLIARVRPDMLSCRFGPGGAYLLRSTLFAGEEVEILGHMLLNDNWLLVNRVARPDFNCWVSGNFLDWVSVPRNIPYIEDLHLVLPWSPYYDALKSVSASREGNIVTVSWGKLELIAGDDSLQIPYLIEAWVCQEGEFVFRAVGSKTLSAKVQDEAGCEEASYARLFGVEKHGYTRWVQIPWP